jgi:DMSO/TMAO reductase YedYZ molybdopterin-dependent catalytic subunit
MILTARRRVTGALATAVTATAATAVAAVAAVSLGGAAAQAEPVAPADRHAAATVVVDGTVTHRLQLTTADLGRLPQRTITVTFESGTGTQTHTYTGPLLLDVLGQAQPRFDPQVKNDKLRHVVTATGSDRYQAAVAWGEFDPDFENKTVLVAVTEDGKPAADGRPRLVVPGDVHGGRYVSSLVRLRLTAPGR